jgi:anti-anti-sigma factor
MAALLPPSAAVPASRAPWPLPAVPLGPDPADLLWVGATPPDRRGRVVVEVVGEVDDYTAPLLESCLRGQSARVAVRVLEVDLTRVRFLSCSAVTVLVQAAQRCARRGARLVVRPGDGSTTSRVLQLTVPDLLLSPPVAAPRRERSRDRRPPRSRRSRRARTVAETSPRAGG